MTPSTPPPVARTGEAYSRFDQGHNDRLTKGEVEGRELFRVLHARPFLANGRISDVSNRVWDVPSTRTDGRTWRCNLSTFDCYDAKTKGDCPDRLYNKKNVCCHARAALLAERQFLTVNRGNKLLSVAAKRVDDQPAEYGRAA
jgi:hypothetical protein